ncbi:Protein of unknown function (DUF3139) [[Clostridium] sordellii]|uniref:DUF3139 domain-containing protein n=1 Tax=Paraclostridium sordellii TaxID=1505 RepID=UPI000308B7AE|nr:MULTISPECIES: DUF3139 domain-containing protein [Paeniclostridium]MBW4864153.1 DUF3139 domain-containing protein [Paeniclostridium sp.]MBW4874152.1 DUF3139 domain-containing protein [Paeniclostridium sp.]MDU1455472.1 DUF3139 domain-containing protein [Paeniclostridium sordellii]TAN65111.1 DUF3139 domain-containing protein [Paeniclostridium sordellii 8483]CEK30106.1 Protein of unknown function (DUF3139) [[Clostridium] sordellii] [Paeniclostridium sordellii]
MKKYKAILLALIIVIIGLTGLFIYNNYSKPWKEAEENINKYMVKQGVSKDDISKITKEKAKLESYNGILYKVIYKDDSEHEYKYFYSDEIYALNKEYSVVLRIYNLNDNKRLEREDFKKVKYPPTYLNK